MGVAGARLRNSSPQLGGGAPLSLTVAPGLHFPWMTWLNGAFSERQLLHVGQGSEAPCGNKLFYAILFI